MGIKNVIKKLNPVKNKTIIDDGAGGIEIKWDIIPNFKKDKISANIEITKSVEDVDFFAVINGNPYKITTTGIGLNNTKDAEDHFSATFGATKRF